MATLRVAVATSGGRDSTALLHCTVRAAGYLGIEVLALHVHHGLMPAADQWQQQVQAQSRRWGARFDCVRLTDAPQPGESIEAWARRERYRALAQMARAADCAVVLLAHHRQDQAETWLLQALRGAGPAGLSAMPEQALRAGLLWARPWLNSPRSAIDAYVQRYRLRYAQDISNTDPRFARSRLRSQVWPHLLEAFADAETTLAQAAQRAQDSAAVLAEVMAADLPALQQQGGLNVHAWLGLSAARRRVSLRAWLQTQLHTPVPGSLVQRLDNELPKTRAAWWPAGRQELRLYRGILKVAAARVEAMVVPARATHTEGPVARLDLSRPGAYAVAGWAGQLLVQPVQNGGVPAVVLHRVCAAARGGGEQFQRTVRGLARSLKKQYQAAGVPAWQRHGPLLWTSAGALLFVPGLGVDARCLAAPGEPQFTLAWNAPAAQPAG